jgi:hypothetical protein
MPRRGPPEESRTDRAEEGRARIALFAIARQAARPNQGVDRAAADDDAAPEIGSSFRRDEGEVRGSRVAPSNWRLGGGEARYPCSMLRFLGAAAALLGSILVGCVPAAECTGRDCGPTSDGSTGAGNGPLPSFGIVLDRAGSTTFLRIASFPVECSYPSAPPYLLGTTRPDTSKCDWYDVQVEVMTADLVPGPLDQGDSGYVIVGPPNTKPPDCPDGEGTVASVELISVDAEDIVVGLSKEGWLSTEQLLGVSGIDGKHQLRRCAASR